MLRPRRSSPIASARTWRPSCRRSSFSCTTEPPIPTPTARSWCARSTSPRSTCTTCWTKPRTRCAMADILVIEDEAALRNNVVRMLSAQGYTATGAANGREGVAAARERRPDHVISDVQMPEKDGFGVLAALRGDESTAAIPFIFLTALEDREHFRRGMGLGADDYLNKPFRREELVSAVEVRLARAAASIQHKAERLSERERQLQEMFSRELLGQTHDKLQTVPPAVRGDRFAHGRE